MSMPEKKEWTKWDSGFWSQNTTLSFPSLFGAGGERQAASRYLHALSVPLGKWEISRQMALVSVGESDVKFMSQMAFSEFPSPNPIHNGPTNSSHAPPLKPLLCRPSDSALFPLIIINDSWRLNMSCQVRHCDFNKCSSMKATKRSSLCSQLAQHSSTYSMSTYQYLLCTRHCVCTRETSIVLRKKDNKSINNIEESGSWFKK